MNKQDLIDFVATKTGLTKKDSGQAVDAVFDGVIEGLKQAGMLALLALVALISKQLRHAKVVTRAPVKRSIFPLVIGLPLKRVKSLKRW
jgi:hypothetical protein